MVAGLWVAQIKSWVKVHHCYVITVKGHHLLSIPRHKCFRDPVALGFNSVHSKKIGHIPCFGYIGMHYTSFGLSSSWTDAGADGPSSNTKNWYETLECNGENIGSWLRNWDFLYLLYWVKFHQSSVWEKN